MALFLTCITFLLVVTFSEKSGLTIFQNLLLSFKSLTFRLLYWIFFAFLRYIAQRLHCYMQAFSFLLDLQQTNLFVIFDLVIISFLTPLVKKKGLNHSGIIFFLGA